MKKTYLPIEKMPINCNECILDQEMCKLWEKCKRDSERHPECPLIQLEIEPSDIYDWANNWWNKKWVDDNEKYYDPTLSQKLRSIADIIEQRSMGKSYVKIESHKINKGDFVKISFNGAQLTLSHNAEVLYVPVEFGDYWILKDVYTGDVHYVSELCTITKVFKK